MALNKEQFIHVWRGSSREDILNQYYYDYEFTRDLCEEVTKLVDYLLKMEEITTGDYKNAIKDILHYVDGLKIMGDKNE